jgi:hypothetical protein
MAIMSRNWRRVIFRQPLRNGCGELALQVIAERGDLFTEQVETARGDVDQVHEAAELEMVVVDLGEQGAGEN